MTVHGHYTRELGAQARGPLGNSRFRLSHADALALGWLLIIFVVVEFPVAVSFAGVFVQGEHHGLSYWWLALPIVTEAIFLLVVGTYCRRRFRPR
jgi:hypothetical protein